MARPIRPGPREKRRALSGSRARLALSFAALSIAAACDGPVGPLPGGALRGEAKPCPGDFGAFANEREVELEVAPERPRSVRIWNVVQGERLYVSGDFLTPGKRWPHQVAADPRVRIRIAGQLFRCLATRVVDASLIEALRREAARKYQIEPDGWAARSEVWWFEIAPRPADPADVRTSEAK